MKKLIFLAIFHILAPLFCLKAAEFNSSSLPISTLSKAIVSVRGEGMESGSGIVLTADGIVLTCSNLIPECKREVEVRFADGATFKAGIIAFDPATESVLLKIAATRQFDFIPLADSSRVSVGATAITAGNPLDSVLSDRQLAISVGTITGSYHVCSADAASRYCGPVLETNAAINSGSEGGALLNESGELIGMTCLSVDRLRMKGTAVPSNSIQTVYAEHLKSYVNTPIAPKAVSNSAFEPAFRALVKIHVPAGQSSLPAGLDSINGVLIDKVGHILTSGTFETGLKLNVELPDGKTARAVVQRQSATYDISLLVLEGNASSAFLPLCERSRVLPGIGITIADRSLASGDISLQSGIVSAVGRLDGVAVQTDVRLCAGNGGGAVLNRRGELIGLVSHTKLMCALCAQNAGVSFFTSSSTLRSWIDNGNSLAAVMTAEGW